MGPFGAIDDMTESIVNVVKDVKGDILNSINGFYGSIKS